MKDDDGDYYTIASKVGELKEGWKWVINLSFGICSSSKNKKE